MDAIAVWAQAMVERGMLESVVAGFGQLRYEVAASVRNGTILWWIAGAVVLFLVFRRRR